MKKMKMRTSALVGGQKNPACALVDRRLRDLGQAVEAKRYLKKSSQAWQVAKHQRICVPYPVRTLSRSRCAAEDPETLLRPSSREDPIRIY